MYHTQYARHLDSYPRTEEDETKTKNVWMKGHTGAIPLSVVLTVRRILTARPPDIGSVSILWSQPVTALQILSPDGVWRYVKHIPNGVVCILPHCSRGPIRSLTRSDADLSQICNAGDSLEMLSGGFYKATIHRVFQPPVDQRGHTRLGLFYFGYTDDDVRLVPLAESPVLQRVGITRKCADEDAPLEGEWRVARSKVYGRSELTRKDHVVEEQVVSGLTVKHYN